MKPIKIYNYTNLPYSTIGVMVEKLDVQNATQQLQLGAFFLNDVEYRFSIQAKIRHNCITFWQKDGEV